MYNIKTLNTISELGTDYLTERNCNVGRAVENPDAMLIRSADIHDYEFNSELLCIARAGAGTNNIPIEKCSEQGIAVFNTPGANAEAVKELIICELIMASRDVLGSIDWTRTLSEEGDKIPDIVEKGKSAFIGPEIHGKVLGVIGLGAVGALVANAAHDLGMTVYGYDPFLSVDAAWRLRSEIIHAKDVGEIFANSDYISINVPHTEKTHHMLNEEAFNAMKVGVRIVNESRAEVVDDDAMVQALDTGKVSKYVTDFPNEKILRAPNVIALPHIGACTPESEEKCAVMAAKEIYDYLKNGNIKNSVNYPDAYLERAGACRICVIHRNVPNMINSFLDLVSEKNLNVEHMLNKAVGGYAYTIVDLDATVNGDVIDRIKNNKDVLKVRLLTE
ncbi:MAG: 3-phosphoglycerate dehydrogenase [Ruminococcaceae bacterium]|nr:3-phosphoglycerate dehydrogenase [Oscillospiraceae bacterium]